MCVRVCVYRRSPRLVTRLPFDLGVLVNRYTQATDGRSPRRDRLRLFPDPSLRLNVLVVSFCTPSYRDVRPSTGSKVSEVRTLRRLDSIRLDPTRPPSGRGRVECTVGLLRTPSVWDPSTDGRGSSVHLTLLSRQL